MRDDAYLRQLAIDAPQTIRGAISAANLTWQPQDYSNISFPAAHAQDNFVYASPPVSEGYVNAFGYQNNYSPIGVVTMSLKVPGTQITLGTFPQAQRVASTQFASNAGLLSVDLIVAIDNKSADGELGVYVAKDVGNVIGLATSADVYDGIIAPQGFYSKRSGAAFSQDISPLIKHNTSVALYVVGYGSTLATSAITITAILRYISLDG